MPENPKVFISYSHDSPEHKRWVLELSKKLRNNGVDVILDQWDLSPGDNLTQFMEVGIRDFDRVLVICTDNYVTKANDREGGVGYEVQIVTSQLVENLGIDKFIPLIRQVSGKKKVPACLEARVYIDFTDESLFDEKLNELLHKLYDVPVLKKPSLGKSPFATLLSGQKASPSEGLDMQLPEIPEQVESALEAYTAAVKIVHAEDEFGWRQLIKRIRPSVFKVLVQWRQNELDEQRPEAEEQLEFLDKAVTIISPLISVALVGVESGREQFRDQKSLLDDLLNIAGWNRFGERSWWLNIPYPLGFVYHSLHGGLCLGTDQLELALNLARVKILSVGETERRPLWENGELMGWSRMGWPAFVGKPGQNCISGWKYLADGYGRWEWLSLIFEDELEYRTSLVAYYMALSVHELATIIAKGEQDSLNVLSGFRFKVPLTFASAGESINKRAVRLLLRDPESLEKLWTSVNVTREQMKHAWKSWMHLSRSWFGNMSEFSYLVHQGIEHQALFEML